MEYGSEETLKRLYGELRALESSVNDERATSGRLREQLRSVKDEFSRSLTARESVEQILKREREFHSALKQEIEAERLKFNEASSALVRCVAERSSFLENLTSLRAALTTVQTKYQAALAELDHLRQKETNEDFERRRLRDEITQLEQKCRDLENVLTAEKEKHRETRCHLVRFQGDREQLVENDRKFREWVIRLQERLKQMEASSSLETSAREKVETENRELLARQAGFEQLMREKSRFLAQEIEAKERLESAKTETLSARAENEALKTEVNAIKVESETLKAENQALGLQLANLESERRVLWNEMKALEAQTNARKREIERLQGLLMAGLGGDTKADVIPIDIQQAMNDLILAKEGALAEISLMVPERREEQSTADYRAALPNTL